MPENLLRFSARRAVVVVVAVVLACFVACGGAPVATVADAVTVSEVVAVVGVPDRGLDPSVVAITNARGVLCSGVLLATDVLLTARQCVTEDAELVDCLDGEAPASPTANPESLHVYTGVPGPSASWVSVGAAVLTSNAPGICGADLAIVVLAWPIDGALPTVVSASGIAEGGYVRTVAFGWAYETTTLASELLREHLPVLDVGASELAVGEATCVGTPGGAAMDETTGQIVGILSRPGAPCGASGQFDVFTRTDAFYELIEDALTWSPELASAGADVDGGQPRDAGRKHVTAHAKKPLTDIGAACSVAAECGTGLCVTAQGTQYCSRTCTPADRCPADFKCVIAAGGASVCIQS